MTNALLAVDTWLTQILTGDATLAQLVANAWAAQQVPPVTPPTTPAYLWVWSDLASQGTPYPHIVFNTQAAKNTLGVGAVRILTDPLYTIKVIGRNSSYAELQPIVERMDTLLESALNAVVNGIAIRRCYQEEAIKYPEVDEGVRYNHIGGMYRIITHAAS